MILRHAPLALLTVVFALSLGCGSKAKPESDDAKSDESDDGKKDEKKKGKKKKKDAEKDADPPAAASTAKPDPPPPATVATDDLSPAQLDGFKAKLDCADKLQGFYCGVLDRFAAGNVPQGLTKASYPGHSCFIKPGSAVEEASFLLTTETGALYDSMYPENEQEKRQIATYIEQLRTGQAPATDDPVVAFSKTLTPAKATPTHASGKSLVFERPIKTSVPNRLHLRESPDALLVVEVAMGPGVDGRIFFIGVFPKSLKHAL